MSEKLDVFVKDISRIQRLSFFARGFSEECRAGASFMVSPFFSDGRLELLQDVWRFSEDSREILGEFPASLTFDCIHLSIFFFFLFVLGRYFSFTALKRKRKFFGALEELFWIFPHILWIVWRNSFARLRFSEMLRDSSEPIFECWWSHEWSSLYSSRVSEILVTSLNIFWRRFDSFEYHFPDIPRDFPAFSNTLGAFFWGMIADS